MSLDEVRSSATREALARRLADGDEPLDAAKHLAISALEAEELALEPDTILLVEQWNPERAEELKALAAEVDALEGDPLKIIEQGATKAARKLVDDVLSGKASAVASKQLLELGIKLRQSQSEKPPELHISLPSTHINPLIDACNEFNGLLRKLIDADESARKH